MSLQRYKKNQASPSPTPQYFTDPRDNAAPQHQHGHHQHQRHQHEHGHGGQKSQQIQIQRTSSRSRKSSKEKSRQSASGRRPTKKEQQQPSSGGGEMVSTCRLCYKVRGLWKRTNGLLEKGEASDVIVRAADGTQFHAHSFVIEVWAPNLLADNRPEGGKPREYTINVDGFTGDVVSACLQLMYGGGVEEIRLDLLSEMVKLASVHKVSDLQHACLEAVSRANPTPTNACWLWHLAHMYGLSNMQERTMRYMLLNVDDILKDETGRSGWEWMMRNPKILLNMFYAISEWTTPKPEPKPIRDTIMDDVWKESEGLSSPYAFPDVTLETKEGEKFLVHLPLLMLSAPDFANYLHERRGSSVEPVRIDNVDGDVVAEFLLGLYKQKPSEDFPELAELVLTLAYEYNAHSMIEACERQVAINRLQSIKDAIEMLLEAEEHIMPTAKPVCFRFFYDHTRELRQDPKWTEQALKNPSLVAEMIQNWGTYRQLSQ